MPSLTHVDAYERDVVAKWPVRLSTGGRGIDHKPRDNRPDQEASLEALEDDAPTGALLRNSGLRRDCPFPR